MSYINCLSLKYCKPKENSSSERVPTTEVTYIIFIASKEEKGRLDKQGRRMEISDGENIIRYIYLNFFILLAFELFGSLLWLLLNIIY